MLAPGSGDGGARREACGRKQVRACALTTMSVTAAPLALMAEKAEWPGVSRKVTGMGAPGRVTSKAPTCCGWAVGQLSTWAVARLGSDAIWAAGRALCPILKHWHEPNHTQLTCVTCRQSL